MTFEEFQASRREVADLRDAIDMGHDLFDGATPGNAYAGGLYIEHSGLGEYGETVYCLTIANDSRESTDLDQLERDLFAYGQHEGLV